MVSNHAQFLKSFETQRSGLQDHCEWLCSDLYQGDRGSQEDPNSVRFTPFPMVCHIAFMYPRIAILPEDPPFHWFLWRDLSKPKDSEKYEFSHVVFGVNLLSFLNQFARQQHVQTYTTEYPHVAKPPASRIWMAAWTW